jgi:acyl-CoA dehydrogenase
MKPEGAIAGASLADRVRAVVAVAQANAEAVDRDGRFPSEAWAALREARLLGLTAPPDLGGEGTALAEIAGVCTALGAACASTGMIFAMHHISLFNLLDCGLESVWHRDLIRRNAREQLLFASATSEIGVGGDLRQSICAVEAAGADFRLAKDAPVISYGEEADAIFATARRAPDAPASDQVLCVLARGQYELERVSTWDALGMRGTCSHGFRLTAKAPLEQILPRPFADIAAESMVAASHLLWGSVWCGVASDAFARAQACVVAEARKRPQSPPASAARLAEAFTRMQAIEAVIRDGLARWDAVRAQPGASPTVGFGLALNALKVAVSSQALELVDEALMITGLAGYKNTGGSSLGRHLRDIHSARLMIGNDRVLAGAGQMLLIQRQPAARRI